MAVPELFWAWCHVGVNGWGNNNSSPCQALSTNENVWVPQEGLTGLQVIQGVQWEGQAQKKERRSEMAQRTRF